MNHPETRSGCVNTAFTALTAFLLVVVGGLLFIYRDEVNQAARDFASLPDRVKALEESVRRTNETFMNYLKP